MVIYFDGRETLGLSYNGGRPAGSTTARFCKKRRSVLVIDGHDSIGEPLQWG